MFAAERALNQERLEVREGMKAHLDKLGRGERLSVEERTDLDQRNARISEIEAELRSYEEARRLSADAAPSAPESREVDTEARERDFSEYLKRGRVSPELRAAGEAAGANGGYLVPPGWWQRLQVALKAYGGISNDFEPIETESGQPMQWATVDPTTTVGTLIGENTQISDVDYTFGTATLGAYMYTSGVQKVSLQLANDSAFDLDSFIRARVGEALGRAQAAAAVGGTGSNQPLGIVTALGGVTASAGTVGDGPISGIGGTVTLATAGVVKDFAGSGTEITRNTINPSTALAMIAAVDPAYRALGAAFYMTDNQVMGLRAQVDSNGRPLLNMQDGLSEGAVGTLFGYPVKVDQNIPALKASTAGGPIFGHLPSAMVKRTVTQSGLLRLSERYADYLQVGFIGFMRFDIRSNDLRAAVTVKAAAS